MFTEASFNKTALTCLLREAEQPVGFAALRVCTQIFALQAQRLIRLPYLLQNRRFCTVGCKSSICKRSNLWLTNPLRTKASLLCASPSVACTAKPCRRCTAYGCAANQAAAYKTGGFVRQSCAMLRVCM